MRFKALQRALLKRLRRVDSATSRQRFIHCLLRKRIWNPSRAVIIEYFQYQAAFPPSANPSTENHSKPLPTSPKEPVTSFGSSREKKIVMQWRLLYFSASWPQPPAAATITASIGSH